MMAFWNWLSREQDSDGRQQNDYAWKEGKSILSILKEAGRYGSHASDAPHIPDEASDSDGIRFADGAMDGIMTHHFPSRGGRSEEDIVRTVVGALLRLNKVSDDQARATLYGACLGESTPSYADAILKRLSRQRKLSTEEVRPHARWLVQEAAHRGPHKLGIALLGSAGTQEDIDDLRILARHDEFALYAAVAVTNLTDEPADILWDMAKHVSGWGKIHVVERLARFAENREDIQGWLLRSGCDNDVMPGYLAYPCATAGHLLEALSVEHVDDGLLEGACLIISALLIGGPVEGVDDYEDGASSVQRLMRHLSRKCDSLSRLSVVHQIRDWIEWPKPRPISTRAMQLFSELTEAVRQGEDLWPDRATRGWTKPVRSELAAACETVLRRPEWPERILEAYDSDDNFQRHLAWPLSKALAVDLWDTAFQRLDNGKPPTKPILNGSPAAR